MNVPTPSAARRKGSTTRTSAPPRSTGPAAPVPIAALARVSRIGSICLAVIVAIIGTLSLPGTKAHAASELRIISSNVMFLPNTPGIVGDWGNNTRAELIAEASYLSGADLVVFQELFDNGPSETLLEGIAHEYPHQTPVLGRSRSGWDASHGYSHLTPEDGGVAVASRWPITRQEQLIFARKCGADRLANKGFVYAELEVNGAPVHVIGTHLQADDPLCPNAPSVRAAQMGQIAGFLASLDLPADEAVFVAGDLNVNRTGPEYDAMLTALDAHEPTYHGHSHSWDAANTLNQVRYAGYGSEHLDYVLAMRGHGADEPWINDVLTPTSPAYTVGGHTYTDYSDHYPIAASLPQ